MLNKKDITLILSLLLLAWGIDYMSKAWALTHIKHLEFYGPFGLVLHRNPGAILGMFSDLPPLLRIVSLSTGGSFLIFIYAAIQYLLPLRSLKLRVGMSLLLGGILGNVTDRILWGSVVDFMLLRTQDHISPAFNFADAIQWVGYGFIVVSLFKEGNQFWPKNDIRKSRWVLPKFQLKYIFVMMAIGVGFSIISGVFSYTYLKITIADLVVGQSSTIEHKFLTPFLYTFGLLSATFILLLFVLGKILSHRTAGPLYAFEKYLEDIIKGKDRKFTLRRGDEFKHLEELAIIIRNRLINAAPPELAEAPPLAENEKVS